MNQRRGSAEPTLVVLTSPGGAMAGRSDIGPSDPANAAALRAVADGDVAAVEGLVDRHKHRLYAHVRRRITDPHRAEDVTQEVFLRLVRAARAGAYTGQASVTTWLWTIANNCVIDHLRSMRSAGRRLERPGEPPDSPTGPDPADAASGSERRAGILQALATLPDEQRQVVELRIFDGLTFGEIAELTGVAVPTAKSRMAYALRKVGQLLAAWRDDR